MDVTQQQQQQAAQQVVTVTVDEEEILLPDSPPGASPEEAGETAEEHLEAKILDLFQAYPVMSPTMLQAAIGPSLSPKLWRIPYDALLAEGILEEFEHPSSNPNVRSRPYKCVRLARAQAQAQAAS